MRIPGDKPSYIDLPKAREKAPTDGASRAAGSANAARTDAAAAPASVDPAIHDADIAAREFEQTISARLDQVREQLRGGTYAIDYNRLAQRMVDEGFGS